MLHTLEQDLARLGADEADLSVLHDAVSKLDGLFLLCIVGEFNSGKSSLINALCGQRLCREGVLPTTSAITLLKHPSARFELPAAAERGGVSVVTVDVEGAAWLRDVHVVDTPGTNTLDASHTALTEAFLPRADLLLFVTSADRPFSESEAKFLRAIQRWHKKVLFVVNKVDLLGSEADTNAVVEYVSEQSSVALGERVPVVPVAARAAFGLKARAISAQGDGAGSALGEDLLPHAHDSADETAARQWARLEALIVDVLRSDARAASKLQSQLSLAGAVLSKYEARTANEGAVLSEDVATLEEASRRLAGWETATAREMEGQRARVQLVLSRLSHRGQDFLATELQLGNLPRLLRRDDFVQRFRDGVLADADEELQLVVAEVAAWMNSRGAAQSRATTEFLEARIGDRSKATGAPSPTAMLASAAWGDGAESPELYHAQRQRLLLGLQSSASKALERYDAQQASARLLTTAHTALAQTALLQAGAMGLSGLVVVKAAALVDLTGLLPAALLAATGFGVLPMQRYRMQRELRDKVDDLTSQLDAAMLRHLQHELEGAASRARELISPFATLAESKRLEHEQRASKLVEARKGIDELTRDVARERAS